MDLLGDPEPGGSTLSLPGSRNRARISQLPGKAQELKASGQDSGQKSPVWLASYAPDTSSWRTLQLCLEGGLAEYSETWPRSGTMQSGIAYQLPTLAHLTAGTDGGVWLTPSTVQIEPTPGRRENRTKYRESIGRKDVAGCLAEQVATPKMWPTPTSRDYKDGSAQSCRNVPENGLLGRVATRGTSEGSLSSTWVCWLMGYPLDWLDIDGYQNPELEGLPLLYLTDPPG